MAKLKRLEQEIFTLRIDARHHISCGMHMVHLERAIWTENDLCEEKLQSLANCFRNLLSLPHRLQFCHTIPALLLMVCSI